MLEYYVFTLVASVLEPLGDRTSAIRLISIPSGAVNVAISSLKSSQHSIITFRRPSLIDSQCNDRD